MSVVLGVAVTEGGTDVDERGSGGDGCDDAPGVTLPDDACLAVSCCLLLVHTQHRHSYHTSKGTDEQLNNSK